jgi:transcriptional regulator with XRE-family HTH domain
MLANLRKSKKLSQNKLATISGVSVRMIQHYEQGIKDINKAQADTVYKLAKALNCNMEDVIDKEKLDIEGEIKHE